MEMDSSGWLGEFIGLILVSTREKLLHVIHSGAHVM